MGTENYYRCSVYSGGAIHRGTPGQMTWLEDPPPWLMTWLEDRRPGSGSALPIDLLRKWC